MINKLIADICVSISKFSFDKYQLPQQQNWRWEKQGLMSPRMCALRCQAIAQDALAQHTTTHCNLYCDSRVQTKRQDAIQLKTITPDTLAQGRPHGKVFRVKKAAFKSSLHVVI